MSKDNGYFLARISMSKQEPGKREIKMVLAFKNILYMFMSNDNYSLVKALFFYLFIFFYKIYLFKK